MTLLGKILTMLIFVMSIVFMAFAIAVYATHRNWRELVTGPTGLEQQLIAQEQLRDQLQTQFDETKKKLAMERASRRLELSGLQSQRVEMQEALREQEAINETLVQQEAEATTALKIAETNLQRLKEEVDGLRTNIRTAQLDRDAQFKVVVEKTDLLNQAESLVKQLKTRVSQLTEQVARSREVLAKHELSEFDPVIDIPPQLEGEVLNVGGTDLVEISVGSDDGLRKGHKLDVSRGDRFIGRIVIVEAFPDRAVGEIVKELRKGRIQRGDRVVTKV